MSRSYRIETDDEEEYRLNLDGPKFHIALMDIDYLARNFLKHGDTKNAKAAVDILEEIRGEIAETLLR